MWRFARRVKVSSISPSPLLHIEVIVDVIEPVDEVVGYAVCGVNEQPQLLA
jgi:hypothetical protein